MLAEIINDFLGGYHFFWHIFQFLRLGFFRSGNSFSHGILIVMKQTLLKLLSLIILPLC